MLGVGVPGAVGGGLEAVPEGEVGCGFGWSWHVSELFSHGQVEVSGLGVGIDAGSEDGAVPDVVVSGGGVLAVLGDDPEAADVDLGVVGYGLGGVGPTMRGLGRLAISVRASARMAFWSSSGVTRVQVDSTMAV